MQKKVKINLCCIAKYEELIKLFKTILFNSTLGYLLRCNLNLRNLGLKKSLFYLNTLKYLPKFNNESLLKFPEKHKLIIIFLFNEKRPN